MKKQRKAQSAPAFFTSANDLVSDVKPKSKAQNSLSKPRTPQTQQQPPQHRNDSPKTQGKPLNKSSQTVKHHTRVQQASPKQEQTEEPQLNHPRTPQSKRKKPSTAASQSNTDKSATSEPKRNYRKANYAFIDGQNLNKAIQSQGWSLDYKEFRKYLEEKYNVKKAYMFIGLITTNQSLYSALQDFGYHLVFKPTIANKFGDVKGNVDAEMVLYAVTLLNQYNKAVIVSGDGDFYTMVQYLQSKGKLEKLLVPNEQAYSALYDTLDVDASFVTDLRKKLEYTKNSQKK